MVTTVGDAVESMSRSCQPICHSPLLVTLYNGWQNNLAICTSLIFGFAAPSRQDVTSIDDSITAGLVTASITSKVQIQSLDLSDVALSAHGCHAVGFVDDALSCSHLGVEEAWRDDVYSSKLAPLSG